MKINKTNVKKMVWVSGTQGRYELNIDSSIPEHHAGRLRGRGCAFSGSILLSDHGTAIAMQRLIRAALIGLDLPKPREA